MAYKFPDQHPINGGITKDTRRASTHLAWLNDMERAIRDLQDAVMTMLGGADYGVIAYGLDAEDNVGKVKATSTPTMRVDVTAMRGIVDGVPFRIVAGTTTPDFTAPSVDDRIDAIAVSATTRDIVIHEGVESDTPSAPAVAEDEVLLAWVYHRAGETVIKDADDSTNGYVVDQREWVNI